MTGKDVLPIKDLLEKAATIKKSEYYLLGKELKAETDIAKKQYQGLDQIYEFVEAINRQGTLKCKSDVTYSSKYSKITKNTTN